MVTHALGTRYVGQVSPIWTPLITVDGGKPFDLSGVDIGTFSLTIRDRITLIDKSGKGSFAYIESLASQGRVAYQWHQDDTSKAGDYLLEVSFQAISGGRQDCDPTHLPVRNR